MCSMILKETAEYNRRNGSSVYFTMHAMRLKRLQNIANEYVFVSQETAAYSN